MLPLTRIRIPKSFNAKVPKSRRDLASSVRNALRENRPPAPRAASTDFGLGSRMPNQEKRITELRRALRAHPCHGCSEREDHARWSERWWKLRRETDGLVRQIQGRTNTIAKTFDRVCDVLSAYGYLEAGAGWSPVHQHRRPAAPPDLWREGPPDFPVAAPGRLQ